MLRRSAFTIFAVASLSYNHAMSQTTPDVKTLEWREIREVSISRADSNWPIIKGYLKDEPGLQTTRVTIGDLNSLLRQTCYDSIMKALDNGSKYKLVLTATTTGSDLNVVQSCTLALRNP